MASTGHLLLAHRCPLLPALHGDAVADGLGMLDAGSAASSASPGTSSFCGLPPAATITAPAVSLPAPATTRFQAPAEATSTTSSVVISPTNVRACRSRRS